MAAGATPDGRPTLLLADTGDNTARRGAADAPTVYEVAEPSGRLPPGVGPRDEQPVALLGAHVLSYPDGPHDVEALLVGRTTRRLAVITKRPVGGRVEVLTAAAPLPVAAGTVALRRSATVDVAALPRALSGLVESELVTAGAVAPDERHLVLRTYTDAYEWPLTTSGDLGAAFAVPPLHVPLLLARQGEGIGYDGSGLVTTSEGRGRAAGLVAGGVVDRYRLLPARPASAPPVLPPPPSAAAVSLAPSPAAVVRPATRSPLALVAAVLATGAVGFSASVVARARRRGRDRA